MIGTTDPLDEAWSQRAIELVAMSPDDLQGIYDRRLGQRGLISTVTPRMTTSSLADEILRMEFPHLYDPGRWNYERKDH